MRTIKTFMLFFCLILSSAISRAIEPLAPAYGIGNPFFALCMDTHDSAKRSLADQAALLKELGYDGCGHLWLDQLPERLKTLDAAGLRLFQVYLRVDLAPTAKEPYDKRLAEMLPLLKGRDVQLAVLVNGLKPGDPAGDEPAAKALAQIADAAQAQGLRVALYPHTNHWLETMDQALALTKKLERPNLGVMFNLCHAQKAEQGELAAVLKKARPHLFAVTINGGDSANEIKDSKGKWIVPLGEGSFDVAGLLRTLRDLAYTGPIGLQCYGIPGDAREHLAKSIAAWRDMSRKLYTEEDSFASMFNGRDLTGWAGDTNWWGVKDGCIMAQSTPEKPCTKQSYLMYRGGEPADFDLRLSFRLVGGNSGIQFRSREIPNWDTRGYQADMDEAFTYMGSIYEHMRKEIALCGQQTYFAPDGARIINAIGDPKELKKHVLPHEWNDYRVLCFGNELTIYINGVMMARSIDDQQDMAARRGIIALQNHPGPPMKVEFRNLRIREFK